MQALTIAPKTTKPATGRAHRRSIALAGRVTWKDARGTTRFACVVTRNISDTGVFIEWREATSIPLYRLVTFQLERDARNADRPASRAPFRQSALGCLSCRHLSEIDRHSGRVWTSAPDRAVSGIAELCRTC